MKINKLLQLLRDNAQAGARNEATPAVRLDATSDAEAHIYVYDVIDAWWGASAAALIEALQGAGDRAVHLHINSPGGDVFEARAMAAAIVAHPGKVTSHIDGLAASAATYLALAASEVRMSDGGLFMVHNSWTIAYGDKAELRGTADLLDKIDGTISADYARRTGAAADQVKAWMDAETWFTAAEALDAKFIDAIDANTKRAAGQAQAQAAANRWDLSAYANAPAALKVANKPTVKPLNSTEADYLSQTAAGLAAMVQQGKAFVVSNPQATLREWAEDCIEDCAGDLELVKLWQQVGTPAEPDVDDRARHQMQMNRNRLRLVAQRAA